MARATKPHPSAHEELGRLRAQTANEAMRGRDLAHRLDVAHAKAQQAEQDIDAGYRAEDEQAIGKARDALHGAEVEAEDLGHRIAAAQARVNTAQQIVDTYAHDNAQALLNECVEAGDQATTRLVAAVHEALGLHRQLLDNRQQQDRIISGGGGEPRLDGPEATHPWERALLELERTVRANPELTPPTPRWAGRQAGQERDRTHALLQAQREGDQRKVEELQR